jgi:formate hydrogenlyase subunit 3/multisubunit Na+/H+ antiporter MnhD subunit
MVLGFIGGMYHLINHSLFKTTLFLGAGACGSVPAIAISKSWAGWAKKCR